MSTSLAGGGFMDSLMSGIGSISDSIFGNGATTGIEGLTKSAADIAKMSPEALKLYTDQLSAGALGATAGGSSLFDILGKGAGLYQGITGARNENKLFKKNMNLLDQQYNANAESLAKRRASDKSLAGAFGTDYWADKTNEFSQATQG